MSAFSNGENLQRAKILLVDADPKKAKLTTQVLTRVVAKPDVRTSLGDIPAEGAYDLIILNFDGLAAEERQRLFAAEMRGRGHLLLMSAANDREELASLFRARTLTNLLATNQNFDTDDLIVTLQKILRKDVFGIEKYFVWGIAPHIVRMTRSADKGPLLEGVQKYTDQIGIPQRLSTLFRTVADEFVTNAVYNAPVDDQGKPRFHSVARTHDIELGPAEEVELKICCDGRRLGISISDPFGSLTPDTILEYLAKCFRKSDDQVDKKDGGAGLGFYQILDSLSHFVVNISPGSRTEMIGLIDVTGSYKDFVSNGKSFNIFVA